MKKSEVVDHVQVEAPEASNMFRIREKTRLASAPLIELTDWSDSSSCSAASLH